MSLTDDRWGVQMGNNPRPLWFPTREDAVENLTHPGDQLVFGTRESWVPAKTVDAVNAIGIDPGPTPGIVALRYESRKLVDVDVIQCSAAIAPALLDRLLYLRPIGTVVQVERFVTGRRSSRSSTAGAGATTRDLVGRLLEVADSHRLPCLQANAGLVKPWATDARLEAAGLISATKGMRHAKDAARHALYIASKQAAMPDPLSKEFKHG